MDRREEQSLNHYRGQRVYGVGFVAMKPDGTYQIGAAVALARSPRACVALLRPRLLVDFPPAEGWQIDLKASLADEEELLRWARWKLSEGNGN